MLTRTYFLHQNQMDHIRYPVEEFVHDREKLQTKCLHAHRRMYLLKTPDKHVASFKQVPQALPASVDLRKKGYCPAALDQGQLGACASNAMSNNLVFLLGKQGLPRFQPSRLALYYNCRVKVEKEPADQDTGVSISDLCTSVQEYHACPEADWPYDIAKFSQAPPYRSVMDAAKHKGFSAKAVHQDIGSIKQCLDLGFPVILGIQVYDSFESQAVAETGLVPMPDRDNESCQGGHAQCLYGYDDEKQAFLSQNSWGQWGINGFSWIPYKYLCDPELACDFWCVQSFF